MLRKHKRKGVREHVSREYGNVASLHVRSENGGHFGYCGSDLGTLGSISVCFMIWLTSIGSCKLFKFLPLTFSPGDECLDPSSEGNTRCQVQRIALVCKFYKTNNIRFANIFYNI